MTDKSHIWAVLDGIVRRSRRAAPVSGTGAPAGRNRPRREHRPDHRSTRGCSVGLGAWCMMHADLHLVISEASNRFKFRRMIVNAESCKRVARDIAPA